MNCNNPNLRDALGSDLKACTEIRGKTMDNPLTPEQLIAIGVTEEKWQKFMAEKKIIGSVYECEGQVVGFCFADTETAEILVLALLADYDNQGIGRKLLMEQMQKMKAMGHNRLWLAASADPEIRAHGFYRHLGWQPTGRIDEHEDEILEFFFDK